MKRTNPNKGSMSAFLLTFKPGEVRYIETSLEKYQTTMRKINIPVERRVLALQTYRFSTSLFTAVSTSKAGDIRYLICIKRTA